MCNIIGAENVVNEPACVMFELPKRCLKVESGSCYRLAEAEARELS